MYFDLYIVHFACVLSFHSKTSIKSKGLVRTVDTNARFRVFPDSFLEEVLFTLQANCFHPFKQISNLEVTVAPEGEKKSIGADFDVVAHHCQVHSNQFDWEGVNNKFHLDFDCTAHDLDDP